MLLLLQPQLGPGHLGPHGQELEVDRGQGDAEHLVRIRLPGFLDLFLDARNALLEFDDPLAHAARDLGQPFAEQQQRNHQIGEDLPAAGALVKGENACNAPVQQCPDRQHGKGNEKDKCQDT